MVFAYTRVSTAEQSSDSQKNLIARFATEHKILVDQWIQVEMSTRKSEAKRKITELLQKLSPSDTILVSELSRLGRSIKDVLALIEEIITKKKCRLILVKQGLDLDPKNAHDMSNKILITLFSMMAELERDFISERTKEGLRARQQKGLPLGKPKGILQKSIYDPHQTRLFELQKLGVPLQKMIDVHLGFGKYLSLKNYLKKRNPMN